MHIFEWLLECGTKDTLHCYDVDARFRWSVLYIQMSKCLKRDHGFDGDASFSTRNDRITIGKDYSRERL